jgi:hypothetical protein
MKQPILFNALAITLRWTYGAGFAGPIWHWPIYQEACQDLAGSKLIPRNRSLSQTERKQELLEGP